MNTKQDNPLKHFIESRSKEFDDIKPYADIEVRDGQWMISQEEAKSFNHDTITQLLEILKAEVEGKKKSHWITANSVKQAEWKGEGFDQACSDITKLIDEAINPKLD